MSKGQIAFLNFFKRGSEKARPGRGLPLCPSFLIMEFDEKI